MDYSNDSAGINRRDLIKGFLGLLLASSVIGNGKTALAASPKGRSLIDFVNPMQGTNSNPGFSTGNTLPLVARPFGVAHWTPQSTFVKDGWIFDPNAHTLYGIRQTHEPSPWMGDYGCFTVMAQVGKPVFDSEKRPLAYTDDEFTVHPNYVGFNFKDTGLQIELAPTERCGVFRFTFPAGQTGRVLVDCHDTADIFPNGNIDGTSSYAAGGVPKNFANYFHAEFDKPMTASYLVQNGSALPGQPSITSGGCVAVVEFAGGQTVTLRVGTSFISNIQARKNLAREVGTLGLDEVREQAAKAWNDALGVVRLQGGTTQQIRTFYSCLYRTHLFPRPIHEYDDNGKLIHYSPYDGVVHPGPLYADTGLWDGYHTLYPLMSLLWPEHLGQVIEGFLNAYRESGWLPQWPSPGGRGGMGGTHSDVLIVEAILKKVPGFDTELAYQAILKNAVVPGTGWVGRDHLDFYHQNGYVSDSVSNSLDYAYDDACIALGAKFLGHEDDYQTLKARALNYRKSYDPSVGFMRCHDKDGNWNANFDEYAWANGYTEGGPWQWSFSVPHDPAGLMALNGGQLSFLAKLDKLMLQPPTFHHGGYFGVIHEMKEMAAAQFGQYAQSNQPIHQMLPLFAAAGAPWKMQYWARRVCDKLYTPDVFPGDEDNGEMAAWYVLNALGLFPSCPGHPTWTLMSPIFRRAAINWKNGKSLVIETSNNGPHNVYAGKVTLNGRVEKRTIVDHADIIGGGVLKFEMAAKPDGRTLTAEDLPFAMSPYQEPIITGPDAWSTHIIINCGGDEIGDIVGDCFVTGGTSGTVGSSPAASTDPDLPASMLNTYRTGSFIYNVPLPMLPGHLSYRVKLYFDNSTSGNILMNGAAATADQSNILPTVDGCITVASAGPAAKLYAISIHSEK
jgi:predicted alpha-1,2-mannosidase